MEEIVVFLLDFARIQENPFDHAFSPFVRRRDKLVSQKLGLLSCHFWPPVVKCATFADRKNILRFVGCVKIAELRFPEYNASICSDLLLRFWVARVGPRIFPNAYSES